MDFTEIHRLINSFIHRHFSWHIRWYTFLAVFLLNSPNSQSEADIRLEVHSTPRAKTGEKLFFSITSYKSYSPKLVLFHKCFSTQHGRISSLLPKCAGQNYGMWHALHVCTESWFACGSSTVVFVHCRSSKWNCYSYKFKFFIHFLLEVFPRSLLRSSVDS